MKNNDLPKSVLNTNNNTKEVGPFVNEDGNAIVLELSYDDSCGNGHNSFGITILEYRRKKGGERTFPGLNGRWELDGWHRDHETISEYFPEYEHMLKWHLTSSDGPMYYVENTTYWAKEGNIKYARSCAVWPEATLEQLSDETALMKRLPWLMLEFKRDIEGIGFTY